MTDLPVRWEGILVMGGCFEMGEGGFIPFMNYPPFRSGQKFYWEENFFTYMRFSYLYL